MSRSETGRGIAPAGVSRVFDGHAARRYDRMVAANPGYHDHLRLSARRMGIRDGGAGLRLLDLGCGTGASTAALLDAAPRAEITAVDASAEMIAHARRKVWPSQVRFVQADVEQLERVKLTGPYDGILAAYLLRNLVDRDAALRRFHALLRPGAPLAVHEYSVRDSLRSRAIWNAVSWSIIIPMCRVRTGSSHLYRYLWRSVLDFDGVAAFTDRMRAAGFADVRVQTMSGWQQQIVHTFLGRRPSTGSPALAKDGAPTGAGEPVTDGHTPTPPAGLPTAEPPPPPS